MRAWNCGCKMNSKNRWRFLTLIRIFLLGIFLDPLIILSSTLIENFLYAASYHNYSYYIAHHTNYIFILQEATLCLTVTLNGSFSLTDLLAPSYCNFCLQDNQPLYICLTLVPVCIECKYIYISTYIQNFNNLSLRGSMMFNVRVIIIIKSKP